MLQEQVEKYILLIGCEIVYFVLSTLNIDILSFKAVISFRKAWGDEFSKEGPKFASVNNITMRNISWFIWVTSMEEKFSKLLRKQ